ncbi:MAG: uncharacterized protein KVP18_004322 [Porospora cf. gigantea A]|uniref:uncharacterized protein n=1 Tax=Porospora cf. gigantea A TaxID=2853593 RepID=UPI003559E3A3|nr:MAG: hypothetical protein KVP18_004322 [Porospora cf. gigantea A]
MSFNFNIGASEFVPNFGGSAAPKPAAPKPAAPKPESKLAGLELKVQMPGQLDQKSTDEVALESSPPVVETTPPAVEKVQDVQGVQEAREDSRSVDTDMEAMTPTSVSKSQVDDEILKVSKRAVDPDPRSHLNVVFIGHVDAGKSTTCGNILYLSGEVDGRVIEKYEREAKDKNRESWFLAFIMDINDEERAKGKTVEVGRAPFATENRRFTILDAPGHKSFVPNMISGAAQADLAVLIISARKGEFETGFEKGGQTREHAMLAKTLGVSNMIVAINKMDESTVEWSQTRYDDIVKKLTPFLKTCGYPLPIFVPISGLSGANIKDHVSDPAGSCFDAKASWYSASAPTLLKLLDSAESPPRSADGPLRVPLLEGYRDQGAMAVGKIEQGMLKAGQTCMLMPAKLKVKVVGVSITVREGAEQEEVKYAACGENVTVKLSGCEESAVTRGSVLSHFNEPIQLARKIRGQVMIVELLDHRPLVTSGYTCIFHAHTAVEDVAFTCLLSVVDKANKKKASRPRFVKAGQLVTCDLTLGNAIPLEKFSDVPQLGRFTLRDEMKTIAIGKVIDILE